MRPRPILFVLVLVAACGLPRSLENGRDCTVDTDCSSGHCSIGQCNANLADGVACVYVYDCKSNACVASRGTSTCAGSQCTCDVDQCAAAESPACAPGWRCDYVPVDRDPSGEMIGGFNRCALPVDGGDQ